ncbi:MAG: acylphosphatase [Euzebyales bacterium]|jgi:acylphosphatase|nr:acylphosphatase [Euzebyales bacterium]MDQ3343977.1 acylphosphatase [Actinomycetota bacterium]
MRRVRITASGTVQGVFFRAAASDEARRLGLTGWVRNTDDDQVEAEAQGDEQAVERFVEFCRAGPDQAQVDDLTVDDLDPVADEADFDVR